MVSGDASCSSSVGQIPEMLSQFHLSPRSVRNQFADLDLAPFKSAFTLNNITINGLWNKFGKKLNPTRATVLQCGNYWGKTCFNDGDLNKWIVYPTFTLTDLDLLQFLRWFLCDHYISKHETAAVDAGLYMFSKAIVHSGKYNCRNCTFNNSHSSILAFPQNRGLLFHCDWCCGSNLSLLERRSLVVRLLPAGLSAPRTGHIGRFVRKHSGLPKTIPSILGLTNNTSVSSPKQACRFCLASLGEGTLSALTQRAQCTRL